MTTSAFRILGNRYLLIRPIGAGSAGEVWRAQHTELGHPVAVKRFFRRASTKRASSTFLHEARALVHIGRHPNIVDVNDAGVDDETGEPFIVMDLLDGQSLADYIERTGCPRRNTLRRWLREIANALAAAHAAKVIHRDVKPSNVFVCRGGSLKLLDFGISKTLADVTETASEAGTPLYSAPEQLGPEMRQRNPLVARSVSPATDVWGFALLALELIGPVRPQELWGVSTRTALTFRLLEDWRPPLRELTSWRPPKGFERWLNRCLHLDATKRYQDISVACDELVALLDADTRWREPRRQTAKGTEVVYSSTAGAKRPQRPTTEPWRWMVTALLLACVVMLALVGVVSAERPAVVAAGLPEVGVVVPAAPSAVAAPVTNVSISASAVVPERRPQPRPAPVAVPRRPTVRRVPKAAGKATSLPKRVEPDPELF